MDFWDFLETLGKLYTSKLWDIEIITHQMTLETLTPMTRRSSEARWRLWRRNLNRSLLGRFDRQLVCSSFLDDSSTIWTIQIFLLGIFFRNHVFFWVTIWYYVSCTVWWCVFVTCYCVVRITPIQLAVGLEIRKSQARLSGALSQQLQSQLPGIVQQQLQNYVQPQLQQQLQTQLKEG